MIGTEVRKALTLAQIKVQGPSTEDLTESIQSVRWINREKISMLINESQPNVIMNFSGVVRQKIQSIAMSAEAVQGNIVLPSTLESFSQRLGIPIISIATDCVFDGSEGNYLEDSAHSGSDIYAMTKRLGEEISPNTCHLRTSVVGLGNRKGKSLAEWFSNLPLNASIDGFGNHIWNGITSKVFAKVILGMYRSGMHSKGTFHLVPKGKITKYEMLCIFQDVLHRADIKITPKKADIPMDRTLSTIDQKRNEYLWELAGFREVPNVQTLLRETLV
jgi:dTDP-4-dehydrorhamnose reductase